MRIRFLVTLAAIGIALVSHAGPARVAVLDFSVRADSGTSERWAWTRSGFADILQIQLQQQGLVLLDRDLIHSVLNEQRLTAGGVTASNQLTVARLLNAQYLISGRVIPLEGERFRVEAGAFSVEAIESVGAVTAEGLFPTDLSSALETVAANISAKLKTRKVINASPGHGAFAPKPESLIMFYRGLDAAARQQPARAAVYFMNAAALDNQFTLPLLWEIKAYEMAGLTNHAASRRAEIADLLKSLGIATKQPAASVRSSKRVIAVMSPLVTGGDTSIEPASLGAELTRALLEKDQVSVFAPEGIGAAVAEQDLKLSALFDAQFAPRYGRWLAADGLLLCRVDATDTDRMIVELSLTDPVTASVGSRAKRVGRQSELNKLLRAGTDDLLRQWTNSTTTAEQTVAAQINSTNSIPADVADLRPVYRSLAAALARVQREPRDSGAHGALADAFASTGRPRLAAIEIERCLALLDIHAPRADKALLGTHRWLFWGASPAGTAVGFVDQKAIDRLIEQLLTTYPDSLSAGCLHYNLAVSDWRAKNWTNAATHAATARRTIRPPEKNMEADHELIAATFFLEGDSFVQLGRTNEAGAVFAKGLEYMDRNNVRNFCLPLGPWVDDFFGAEKVYGYGGDRPGIRTRIEEALVKLNGTPPPTNNSVMEKKPVVAAEPDTSPVVQLKRADVALQSGRYTDALQAYNEAFAEGASLEQGGGLRTALAELALERNRNRAVEEAERCRVEFGLPPVTVTWVEWFWLGQKYRRERAFDFEKAAAAYRAAMDFLEHPERSGLYRVQVETGWRWTSLRWGPDIGGVDLHWGEKVGERWNNAAFHLAECLIELGRREEAAQWLRRVALDVGGDDMPLFKDVGWSHANYTTVKLGVMAADKLKELHLSLEQPKFGEADGPYKTPPMKSRAKALPPLPAIAPEVMQALTNALAESSRAPDESRTASLKRFADRHAGEVVPAALTLLTNATDARTVAGLTWLLNQNATTNDAPRIVAACQTRWELVSLANRLAPAATAAALTDEWRSCATKNFIPPDLIRAIVNARVRLMFAPVLDQISDKWVNHHMVVFLMDKVVAEEKSDELEAAFRDALGRCLRLKLEQNDRYELSRIAQIALRHGVPEAIEASVISEGASPGQLRKLLAPVLELPPGDEQALTYLRTNRSRWEWDSVARKFKPAGDNKL